MYIHKKKKKKIKRHYHYTEAVTWHVHVQYEQDVLKIHTDVHVYIIIRLANPWKKDIVQCNDVEWTENKRNPEDVCM